MQTMLKCRGIGKVTAQNIIESRDKIKGFTDFHQTGMNAKQIQEFVQGVVVDRLFM